MVHREMGDREGPWSTGRWAIGKGGFCGRASSSYRSWTSVASSTDCRSTPNPMLQPKRICSVASASLNAFVASASLLFCLRQVYCFVALASLPLCPRQAYCFVASASLLLCSVAPSPAPSNVAPSPARSTPSTKSHHAPRAFGQRKPALARARWF